METAKLYSLPYREAKTYWVASLFVAFDVDAENVPDGLPMIVECL